MKICKARIALPDIKTYYKAAITKETTVGTGKTIAQHASYLITFAN